LSKLNVAKLTRNLGSHDLKMKWLIMIVVARTVVNAAMTERKP
jgi:hypothetical protein